MTALAILRVRARLKWYPQAESRDVPCFNRSVLTHRIALNGDDAILDQHRIWKSSFG